MLKEKLIEIWTNNINGESCYHYFVDKDYKYHGIWKQFYNNTGNIMCAVPYNKGVMQNVAKMFYNTKDIMSLETRKGIRNNGVFMNFYSFV